MKKNNKLKLLIVMCTVIFMTLTFSVSAEEGTVSNEEFETSSDSASVEGDINTDTDATDNSSGTFFDEIYRELVENADKIFAALAFIGTLLVSFAYRKGLIPLLKGAIASLSGSVNTIKESGTELARCTDSKLGTLCDNMQEMLYQNAKSNESIEEISKRLDALDTVAEKYNRTKVVLSSQIDMLYVIFMSSALPQYQKEEVSERIKQMKEELEKYESSEE